MKTTLILMLVLLLVVGCSSAQEFPITIQLDETWTEEEFQVIDSAFQEWQEATSGMAKYVLVEGYPHTFNYDTDYQREDDQHVIYRLTETEMTELREGEDSHTSAGITSHDVAGQGGVIVVSIDAVYANPRTDTLWRTVAHEIGHLYGIHGHVEEGASLMNPSLDTIPDCIDGLTLARICNSLYDCTANPTCK